MNDENNEILETARQEALDLKNVFEEISQSGFYEGATDSYLADMLAYSLFAHGDNKLTVSDDFIKLVSAIFEAPFSCDQARAVIEALNGWQDYEGEVPFSYSLLFMNQLEHSIERCEKYVELCTKLAFLFCGAMGVDPTHCFRKIKLLQDYGTYMCQELMLGSLRLSWEWERSQAMYSRFDDDEIPY